MPDNPEELPTLCVAGPQYETDLSYTFLVQAYKDYQDENKSEFQLLYQNAQPEVRTWLTAAEDKSDFGLEPLLYLEHWRE